MYPCIFTPNLDQRVHYIQQFLYIRSCPHAFMLHWHTEWYMIFSPLYVLMPLQMSCSYLHALPPLVCICLYTMNSSISLHASAPLIWLLPEFFALMSLLYHNLNVHVLPSPTNIRIAYPCSIYIHVAWYCFCLINMLPIIASALCTCCPHVYMLSIIVLFHIETLQSSILVLYHPTSCIIVLEMAPIYSYCD